MDQKSLLVVYGQLQYAVRRLAQPAPEQLAYLRALGPAPLTDELALEFDDVYPLVEQLHEAGLLTDSGVAALKELDAHLERMSGAQHADLWQVTALAASPAWAEVRSLANEVMRVAGWLCQRSQV